MNKTGETAFLGNQPMGVAGGDFLEIGAGAEHLVAAALQNHGADVVVRFGGFDRGCQSLGHVAVDGVAGLRPIESDQGNVIAQAFQGYGVIGVIRHVRVSHPGILGG